MAYLFTSESVSEGHPDKVADQISDALIDNFLAFDPDSKVACETLVTTGQVVLAGEGKSKTYLDVQKIARDVINKIGYTKSDYATDETENFMPLALELSHRLLIELAELRRENKDINYLRPDAKSQVTIEYSDDNVPQRIDAIVVSTQHDDFDPSDDVMLSKIKSDITTILIPRVVAKLPADIQALFNNDITYHINPTGTFVIGGPHGDTGLTGRKIIVDTYGGKGAHGGGAFSGKDPSKVDRSGAYATRHIAKNLVASGLCKEALVQVSYAIGVAKPTSINVETYGSSTINMTDGEISKVVETIFDMRPYFIEQRLKLRTPIYSETAAYGHMGRTPEVKTVTFTNPVGETVSQEVETFTWEKLDYVDAVRKAFGFE